MAEETFFDQSFLGSRNHYQHDRVDAVEFQVTSAAWALFECYNVTNPLQQAMMRIYYQIPYAGSGLLSARARASQATPGNIFGHAVRELSALRELAAQNCSCAPTLIDHKQDVQDDDGPLPDGYRFYMVMTRVPGISLTRSWGEPEAVFWTLPKTVRATIRDAFRDAYQ
jgi:hypothetical protein